MFVCLYPAKEGVWKALSYHMNFITETWNDMTPHKVFPALSLFGITQDELDVVSHERIKELILERICSPRSE